jgi:hypothetical protein
MERVGRCGVLAWLAAISKVMKMKKQREAEAATAKKEDLRGRPGKLPNSQDPPRLNININININVNLLTSSYLAFTLNLGIFSSF